MYGWWHPLGAHADGLRVVDWFKYRSTVGCCGGGRSATAAYSICSAAARTCTAPGCCGSVWRSGESLELHLLRGPGDDRATRESLHGLLLYSVVLESNPGIRCAVS